MIKVGPQYSPMTSMMGHHMMHELNPDTEGDLLIDHEEFEPPESKEDTDITDAAVNESLNYSPNKSDFSSVVTDGNKEEEKLPPDENTEDDDRSPEETGTYLGASMPSEITEYYNETSMTAKVRNALPDSAFGLPRLRAYPLTDEKHVRQAIRMFSHCKDPKDKETLAKNIFAKVNELKMSVTIGKNNALYEYAPKALQESTLSVTTDVIVPKEEVSMSGRTKDQIIKEHLRRNCHYYNNLFFNTEFAASVKALDEYQFLNYFYPDFKRHNLYSRISCALGGLGRCKELYDMVGFRYPLETDFTKTLVWPLNLENFDLNVTQYYDTSANWFRVDISKDFDHVLYCLRLYSLLGEIVNNPNFDVRHVDVHYHGLMTDWTQKVMYHYDLMLDASDEKEHLKQCQYLFDLGWSFCDNPHDEFDISTNILAFIHHMASARTFVATMNESGELISKEDCAAYLVHELGLDDDIFLLPDSLEYPVLNKGSVRMAMDFIGKIPEESRATYVSNLNRKYKELGCTFSISVDHPYAKYADKNIINNMIQVLMEGDTAVADDTKVDSATETQPWFKRFTEIEYPTAEFYPNRELGPNMKKTIKDFTRTEAIM